MYLPEYLKKYLIWPLASILVFLAVAESVLHIIDVDPHPKGFDFIVNRALDFPEAFIKDKELFWRLRPGRVIESEFFLGKSYRINRQGYRGQNFRLEKTGLRIAILGNSCSFGWRVDDSETFADRLQNILRSRGGWKDAEVYNFSVPGYTSFQGKRNYLRNIRPYKPDILLVTFAWNDQWLSANNRPDKEQKMPPQAVLDVYNLVGRLRSYRVFKSLLFSLIPRQDTLVYKNQLTRVSLPDFKVNLGEIIQMAREDGAQVILLTSPIPSMKSYYGSDEKSFMHEMHYYYNDVTREAAAIYSIRLVDLAAIFDQYDNLFDSVATDPFHYNSRGHALAAEEIFREINQMPLP